ncbi:MAG: hypothetical protein ACREDR_03540 [Blastocatellia bacterium]
MVGALEELSAEKVQEIEDRRADGRLTSPLGQREEMGAAVEAVGKQGGKQKKTIGRDLKLRQTGNRLFGSDLALTDPDKRLFVTVIALDFPSVDIGLDKSFQRKVDISADQESGLAKIPRTRILGEMINNGTDREDTQRTIRSGFGPKDGADCFNSELSHCSGNETRDGL